MGNHLFASMNDLKNQKEDLDVGYLLVKKPLDVKKINIDSNYVKKVYFDKSFLKTTVENAEYILFSMITPGNTLITLVGDKKIVINDIVHIHSLGIICAILTLLIKGVDLVL